MTDHNNILQKQIPFEAKKFRLPGLNALHPNDWLYRDDAFDAQLSYAEHLLKDRRQAVYQTVPNSEEACVEVLDLTINSVMRDDGYSRRGAIITRPDGVDVDIMGDEPLVIARRLAQQDICLLDKVGDEHILSAAAVCFPANWRLSNKIGRPLSTIHDPVAEYDENITRRVQRIFDMIQVGKPMWRSNYLIYQNADLHQPTRFVAPEDISGSEVFTRVERQTLYRLPQTGLVVFGIHTFVVGGRV